MVGGGVLVLDPVEGLFPLEVFGSFAGVVGFGLRRLVLGAVFVLVEDFSLGRDTRNAPRTSSWLSTAIGIAANATAAHVTRTNLNFMQVS